MTLKQVPLILQDKIPKEHKAKMIIKPELVRNIKNYFSLNIYETKVWLALLGKGIASAGEIAEVSGVPRSRTYDVLESLEKEGFAISKIGKPVKYIAVKPTTVIEKIKSNINTQSKERLENLSKLKTTEEYTEIEDLYKTGIKPIKHEDLSGAIKGKSNLFNHIKELAESANKEVIISTSTHEINEKARTFAAIFATLKRRRITLKIALSGEESEIKKINNKFKIKAEKLDINSRFVIIDKEQALLMLSQNPKDEDEVGIWINSDFFVNALAFLFEQAMIK